MNVHQQIPENAVDLFGELCLTECFLDYRRRRDAGPMVRSNRSDLCAIGRCGDVRAAQRVPETPICGEGVGFSEALDASGGLNVLHSDFNATLLGVRELPNRRDAAGPPSARLELQKGC